LLTGAAATLLNMQNVSIAMIAKLTVAFFILILELLILFL